MRSALISLFFQKNRKAIPCYWETQPSGCRKPHCPFQHKNPREVVPETVQVAGEAAHDQQKNDRAEWSRRQGNYDMFNTESDPVA